MWALVEIETNKVLTVYPPDFNKNQMEKEAEGRLLIEVTLENSPGWVNGTYENGKFYPPKELING